MLLVTGAGGVGKSTVRALIAEELAPQVRAVELTQIAAPARPGITIPSRRLTVNLIDDMLASTHNDGRRR